MTRPPAPSRRTVLATASLGTGALLAGCGVLDSSDDGGDDTGGTTSDDGDELSQELRQEVDGWPLFRRDQYNTGRAHGTTVIDDPVVEWEYETEGDIWGSPVVADGTVYIPSYDQSLYALDLETGQREWRFEMDAISDATPGVSDGMVVCGSFDRHIYGIDAETGQQQWAHDTGGIVRSGPTIVDDTVYIGAHCQVAECAEYEVPSTGELLALDLETGRREWRFEAATGVLPTPAVTDQRVYVGASSGELRALDRETGDEVWTSQTGDWIFSSPAVVDGSVYFGDMQGVFRVLDAEDGSEESTYETESRYISSSPAVGPDGVYIGGALRRTDGPAHGTMLGFDRSGEHRWTTRVEADEIGSAPLLLGDRLYVGSHLSGGDGQAGLHCVRTDGSTQWRFDVPGRGVGSSPAIADGLLVFGTVPGSVVALRAPP